MSPVIFDLQRRIKVFFKIRWAVNSKIHSFNFVWNWIWWEILQSVSNQSIDQWSITLSHSSLWRKSCIEGILYPLYIFPHSPTFTVNEFQAFILYLEHMKSSWCLIHYKNVGHYMHKAKQRAFSLLLMGKNFFATLEPWGCFLSSANVLFKGSWFHRTTIFCYVWRRKKYSVKKVSKHLFLSFLHTGYWVFILDH